MTIPLPKTTAALIENNQTPKHLGLFLEKYVNKDERNQKEQSAYLKSLKPYNILTNVLPRQTDFLNKLQAKSWKRSTLWRLAIHLSKSAAWENTGLCLHPIYGFPYLPGSGLKGMAHCYAVTEWLPNENDQQKAWNTIAKIFGAAPSPWLSDLINRVNDSFKLNITTSKESITGKIIFHDAWPTIFPKLEVDILNPHYKPYYEEKKAPGDWHNPEPSYFLTVAPRSEFLFALSPQDPLYQNNEKDLELAKSWLNGALTELGAGGKTAVGYGYFQPEGSLRSSFSQKKVTDLNKKAGDIVTAVLSAEKTRRTRGWKAEYDGFMGNINIIGEPPTNWEPGMEIQLKISSLNNDNTLTFKWPV